MGILSGFTYNKLVKKLRKFGFKFDRQASGSHEIWWNPQTKKRTTIPNHTGEIPIGTMRAILKQGGISIDDFIKK